MTDKLIDRATVRSWLAGYVRAWTTNDPADIEALFTPDAVYRPTPHSDGWHGHRAIVAGWIGRKDDPGTWSFEHTILAVDGDVAVVEGRTAYKAPPLDYSNLWVLRFAPDGRCREYVEWWVDRNAPDPGEPSAG
jgi:ketosteroid isomerase-like protein